MNQSLIMVPFVGMLLLTFGVSLVMFYQRISIIVSTGVQPQTRADLEKFPTYAVNSANNFQNLFELPVAFYATVLALYVTQQVDLLHVQCAFGFLVFRIAHSVIHCTYNRIPHRFAVYAIAGLFLSVMVIRLSWGVLKTVQGVSGG